MRYAALLLALVCACEPAADVWLAYPETGTAKTMVVAHREADLELEAVDLTTSEGRFTANIRLGDAPPYRTVYALLYDKTLSRLGYSAGSMPRGSGPADGELLLAPDRLFVTDVADGSRAVAWRSEGALPGDIRDFRVRADDECATFGPATSQHFVDGNVFYAVDLDGTNALIRSTNDVFLLSVDGRRDLASATLRNSTTAFLAPDGALYVGDASGRIWRGTPSAEQGLVDEMVVAAPGAFAIRAMDGGYEADGESLEIYYADAAGQIGRLSGTVTTPLQTVARYRTPLVWTAPGRAFLATLGIDTMHAIVGDVVTQVEIGAESQIMHISRHPTYGALAGTAEGHFFGLDVETEGWSRIVGGDFGWWALASAYYEDGFVFLLASGFFGQYKRSRGYCESAPLLPILEAGLLLSMGRDVIVTAVPDERATTTVLYVPRL